MRRRISRAHAGAVAAWLGVLWQLVEARRARKCTVLHTSTSSVQAVLAGGGASRRGPLLKTSQNFRSGRDLRVLRCRGAVGGSKVAPPAHRVTPPPCPLGHP